MHLKSVLQMGSLAVRFRNGLALAQHLRTGEACDEVVLWDGTRIAHPAGSGGMLEALVELWLEETYTKGFYRPADGDVVIDAGANIGLFAIYVARQNSKCRVLALEPFADNFRCLQANVQRASSGNVRCFEMALGARFGKGHMQAVSARSLDHVLKTTGNDEEGTQIIPLSGLLDLAGSNEIDFLKVDIEGSEREVFADVSPELLKHFKRIALEYHDNIAPGTLELLQRVLAPTHDFCIHPADTTGCGIIQAQRHDLE